MIKEETILKIIFLCWIVFGIGIIFGHYMDSQTETAIKEIGFLDTNSASSDFDIGDFSMLNNSFMYYSTFISYDKAWLKENNLTCYYWENYTSLGLKCEERE